MYHCCSVRLVGANHCWRGISSIAVWAANRDENIFAVHTVSSLVSWPCIVHAFILRADRVTLRTVGSPNATLLMQHDTRKQDRAFLNGLDFSSRADGLAQPLADDRRQELVKGAREPRVRVRPRAHRETVQHVHLVVIVIVVVGVVVVVVALLSTAVVNSGIGNGVGCAACEWM